jgi:hypothetical protein
MAVISHQERGLATMIGTNGAIYKSQIGVAWFARFECSSA